jgi:predicted enzyme related to lactoylglutathione lyase
MSGHAKFIPDVRWRDDTSDMANPVVWWEIQVDDVDKARAFYSELFGWSFESPMGPTYAIVLVDGDMVGALSSMVAGTTSTSRTTRIYLGTDDMDGVLAKVEPNGGKILEGRTLITEEFGWYATFADPSGVTVGLSTTKPPA